MTELLILTALLIVVGIVGYNAFRKKDDKPTLEKTTVTEVQSTEPLMEDKDYVYKPCALATILRIIGVVNVFAGLILGLVSAEELGGLVVVVMIFTGVMGCLFCYAFAKCVDAAHKYLNS